MGYQKAIEQGFMKYVHGIARGNAIRKKASSKFKIIAKQMTTHQLFADYCFTNLMLLNVASKLHFHLHDDLHGFFSIK